MSVGRGMDSGVLAGQRGRVGLVSGLVTCITDPYSGQGGPAPIRAVAGADGKRADGALTRLRRVPYTGWERVSRTAQERSSAFMTTGTTHM